MSTEKLTSEDFTAMGVHRPLVPSEIDEVHPQANVDKTMADETGKPMLRVLDPLPDNVELLDMPTSHQLQVKRVLQSALDHELDDVMVVGWVNDGPIFFLATDPSVGNAVYRLELAKQRLLAAVTDRWETEIPTTRDLPDEPA